ncbi:MAG: hypothetical protein HY869_20930 [Chloroflexi bacterium]|nr:hypothetical protein [Chloroflexota bacterium]
MNSSRKRIERSMGGETTRLSVTVPIETKEAIDQFAEEMGVTTAHATQHFIKIGMTAEAIALEGGEVIARYANGDQVPVANSRGNFFYRRALVAS